MVWYVQSEIRKVERQRERERGETGHWRRSQTKMMKMQLVEWYDGKARKTTQRRE
jgi:hypothetical protein